MTCRYCKHIIQLVQGPFGGSYQTILPDLSPGVTLPNECGARRIVGTTFDRHVPTQLRTP